MSGDRTLDERVYVEVFGNELGRRFHTVDDWKISRGMTRRDDFQRCKRCRTQRKKLSRTHWDDNTLCVPSVPRYSSDIAAAWLVVSQLASRSLTVTVVYVASAKSMCVTVDEPQYRRLADVCQVGGPELAPLLICRAALAAVRQEVRA